MIRILVIVLAVAVLPTTGLADMGVLEQYLPAEGSKNNLPWKTHRDDTYFYLSNHEDSSAITYFYADADASPGSHRQVSVDVEMRHGGDGSAKAGLIYGYDPKNRSYFLFVIQPGQKVSLIRRDTQGVNSMLEIQKSSIRDGVNTLAIEETDDGINLTVNGELISGLGTAGIGQGGAGIAAAGLVDARFANFFIDTGNGKRASTGPQASAESNTSKAGSVAATTALQATANQSTTIPAPPLRLRPIQIMDESGPFGRVPAYTTMLPEGWKTEGGVVWHGANDCVHGPQINWNAESPDGAWSVAFLPMTTWGTSSDGIAYGCINRDIPDAETAANLYVEYSSDIQMTNLKFERPPDVRQFAQQFAVGQLNMQGIRSWTDGGVLEATLTDPNGGKHDGAILVVTSHTEMNYGTLYGMQGGARFGLALLAIATGTPPGHGDDLNPGIIAILQNLRANPQWNKAVNQWQQAQKPKKQSGGGKSVAEINSEILDSSMTSYRRRIGMQDTGHRKAIGGIGETQRYTDTTGKAVDLDMNYKHAWQLDDGSIVQTNDALFNPMQTFGKTGTELDPER